MTTALYALRNGENDLGIVWADENGKLMFITRPNVSIDFNHDIQIRSTLTGQDTWIDLRQIILDAIDSK